MPDYSAIQQYLIYGYIPAPKTGFEGIKKLKHGHYLFLNLKRKTIKTKRYWEPVFQDNVHLSENEWCREILTNLEEATKLRMIADVEIGAFLSGGVDSSGVVATMASLSPRPIKTFTIAFSEKEADESRHAARIAKIYKTDHHVLLAKPESIEILPFLANQYEEPLADSSSLITYLINKLARKYIKVVLNGDGGDENFAGYPNRYLRLNRDVNYYNWINTFRPLALASLKISRHFSKNPKLERFEKFLNKSKLPLYQRFISYNQTFNQEELTHHLQKNLTLSHFYTNIFRPVEEVFRHFKGKNPKNAGLKFDLLYWLPDDLLTKIDIA